MARGWHYNKLSLSSALPLFFFLHVLCLFVVFVLFVSFKEKSECT